MYHSHMQRYCALASHSNPACLIGCCTYDAESRGLNQPFAESQTNALLV